ncbi:hypothetical protein QL285_052027 [Trifolium repens]|nr:hypothetical protein QL285_052027 [Trifolium repens]
MEKICFKLIADFVLFLCAKFPLIVAQWESSWPRWSASFALITSEFALGFKTKVVALCLNFQMHGHRPQSDIRSSNSDIFGTMSVFLPFFAPFYAFSSTLVSWSSNFVSLGFCLVIGLQSD